MNLQQHLDMRSRKSNGKTSAAWSAESTPSSITAMCFILLVVVTSGTAIRAFGDASVRLTASQTQIPDASTSSGVPIVAVGCVNRAGQSGSMAGAGVVPPATPETVGKLANSSEPTNVFLLNGATQPSASGQARARASSAQTGSDLPAAYVLDGKHSELDHHAGHRVEVTGMLLTPVVKGDGPSVPASTKSNVKHIQVASIRMIAATCTMSVP